mmetsp:Transcript_41402/g.61904  ORF Transcript_41402/g.61904 Transcript_41402/m.61904 type:complete len:80 (+) Transcript_41402:96-335(+)
MERPFTLHWQRKHWPVEGPIFPASCLVNRKSGGCMGTGPNSEQYNQQQHHGVLSPDPGKGSTCSIRVVSSARQQKTDLL